jgi:hypothetical protein
LLALNLISCSKKQAITPLDITGGLTNGSQKKWLLTNITSNGKSILSDCAKDDVYTFIKQNNQTIYSPNIACYESDIEATYSYEIDNSKRTININSQLYKIDELSSKRLIFSTYHEESQARLSPNFILHSQQTLTLQAL